MLGSEVWRRWKSGLENGKKGMQGEALLRPVRGSWMCRVWGVPIVRGMGEVAGDRVEMGLG